MLKENSANAAPAQPVAASVLKYSFSLSTVWPLPAADPQPDPAVCTNVAVMSAAHTFTPMTNPTATSNVLSKFLFILIKLLVIE
ncbi:MAG: hypothetical protein J6B91_11585 [Prevotella sp.]|nr:hypothetical protein [Prevotella sp.]